MSALKKYARENLHSSQMRLMQDVRYEAHLQMESLKNRVLPGRRSRIKQLQQQTDLKLHWGCGRKKKEGWVNVDGWASAATDLVYDLRNRMPLADGSVAMIFTEHVFEHFTFADGEKIAADFHRVLKPGGTLRLIVPDLQTFAERYVAGDREFMANFHPQARHLGEGLNNIFYGHFHRGIYDYPMLEDLLKRVGFSAVRKADFHDSAIEELNQELPCDGRMPLNLYVEAVK